MVTSSFKRRTASRQAVNRKAEGTLCPLVPRISGPLQGPHVDVDMIPGGL